MLSLFLLETEGDKTLRMKAADTGWDQQERGAFHLSGRNVGLCMHRRD